MEVLRGDEEAEDGGRSRRVAATVLRALKATKYASAFCKLGESRSGNIVSLQKAVSVTIIRARRSPSPSEGESKGGRDDDEKEDVDDRDAAAVLSKETLIFLAGRRRAWDRWVTISLTGLARLRAR